MEKSTTRWVRWSWENIDEECSPTPSGAKKKGLPFCDTLVEKNIEEALLANNVLPRGFKVTIPAGATISFDTRKFKDDPFTDASWHFAFEASDGKETHIGSAVARFTCWYEDGEEEDDIVCVLNRIEGILKKNRK
ncbi:MAG: hypothetical protein QXJ59_04475 [Thermofilaceae archaeon]